MSKPAPSQAVLRSRGSAARPHASTTFAREALSEKNNIFSMNTADNTGFLPAKQGALLPATDRVTRRSPGELCAARREARPTSRSQVPESSPSGATVDQCHSCGCCCSAGWSGTPVSKRAKSTGRDPPSSGAVSSLARRTRASKSVTPAGQPDYAVQFAVSAAAKRLMQSRVFVQPRNLSPAYRGNNRVRTLCYLLLSRGSVSVVWRTPSPLGDSAATASPLRTRRS